MQLGVIYPHAEYGSDPGSNRDYAQTAESLGFNHMISTEHVLGVDPADRPGGFNGHFAYETPFRDSLTFFAWLSGVTTTLNFMCSCIVLPQKSAPLVAKQAAEVDIWSGGRLRVGVTVGWSFNEFDALGANFHNRNKRLEEGVEVMRALWTNEIVSFKGKYHDIDRLGLNPMPITRPIPVWFGGPSEAGIKRAARLGDGWIPLVGGGPEGPDGYRGFPGDRAKTNIGLLWDEVEKNGRRKGTDVGLECRIPYLNGNPETWREAGLAWKALGATHLDMVTMGAGFTKPQQHLDALAEMWEAVKDIR